ncbi:hypothetical protein [Algoriphagus winogradskyi]|jgi:hypothetical protein|uniref:RiboL-PSP-HEPN domain-containing protein n=1 Tax=Algoriphagus winogradskyi TaxID=237017 RepID=A0ABY1NT80_9BACT|nr:hypothetical protein [Algoriphagus winogradskyi]SMP16948.1 hypothetical protein SAMN06265367_102687 [Algoriphagus winogradskyi]
MFEKLIKEIEKMERMKISIPLETDADGYIDKECPSEECLFQFKIKSKDWTKVERNDVAFCPYCRHEDEPENWYTTEQVEDSKKQAINHIQGRIGQALRDGANDFNARQPKKGFITMSLSVKGTAGRSQIMPIPAAQEMRLHVQCEQCDTEYAFIGSAFFCPCCGHNSAQKTFELSINKIRESIKNLPDMRIKLQEFGKDAVQNTCQSLIEKGLLDCVTAFQRYCEMIFSEKAPDKKFKMNAFQNLEIGGDLWKESFGSTYTDWLSNAEFSRLVALFQRRHLLAHTEGIVDQKYLEKSGDNNCKVGQRISIKEKDVLELIGLICIITDEIKKLS